MPALFINRLYQPLGVIFREVIFRELPRHSSTALSAQAELERRGPGGIPLAVLGRK